MFHVKHNNRDNFIPVHIGDRTHAHAGRPAGKRADRRASGQAIDHTRQWASNTSGGQYVLFFFLLYRRNLPLYMQAVLYVLYLLYIGRKKPQKPP